MYLLSFGRFHLLDLAVIHWVYIQVCRGIDPNYVKCVCLFSICSISCDTRKVLELLWFLFKISAFWSILSIKRWTMQYKGTLHPQVYPVLPLPYFVHSQKKSRTHPGRYKQQTLSSLGIKVHSNHISPLIRREKVIANNNIAIVDIDRHGDSILVHDAPLLIVSILWISTLQISCRKLDQIMDLHEQPDAAKAPS